MLIRRVNLKSWKDTIVSNEKASSIEGNGINKTMNKNVIYLANLVLHDKDPYYLEYIANTKDFQKYLPQFEQMLKTFILTKMKPIAFFQTFTFLSKSGYLPHRNA